MAWIGHPYANNVTTMMISVGGVLSPSSMVPRRELKVLLHTRQR
jgi:hypothetical protein